jgi:hypothetical protein
MSGQVSKEFDQIDGDGALPSLRESDSLKFARTFVKGRGQSDGMVGRFSFHLAAAVGGDSALEHFDIASRPLGWWQGCRFREVVPGACRASKAAGIGFT